MSSLDEILCCYYSNEIVLTEFLNGTLHFVGFYKRKSAIFVFFHQPLVEMKGLTLTLKKFINPCPSPSIMLLSKLN